MKTKLLTRRSGSNEEKIKRERKEMMAVLYLFVYLPFF
jgi:hypothetical protein